MNLSPEEQVSALDSMSFAELNERWIELYGEPTHSKSSNFIRRRLAWRIQCIAEGDLTERARRRAYALANDADLKNRHSGMPSNETMKTITSSIKSPPHDSRLPNVGTKIVRTYKGNIIEVSVLKSGFKYNGKVYSSLSTIATEVTGTRWNGFTFFGLKKKG